MHRIIIQTVVSLLLKLTHVKLTSNVGFFCPIAISQNCPVHTRIQSDGSRRQASNDEVRELAKVLAQSTQGEFPIVECAFLELAEPLIPDGVSACVQKGAETVTVLPYFLSAGRHVVTDIPEELEKAQSQNPTTNIKTAPYLGSAQGISEILISLSKQAT